jgi:16S rRNA (guanine966-N2)-methyltransferase
MRLVAPRGGRTRPTADRVKESVFGALGPDRLVDARVLDGYAGTGALAIEALSRGARSAVLVDRDPSAIDAIRRNLRTTDMTDRAIVQRRGLLSYVRGTPPEEPFDLVFLDPPYDSSGSELSTVLTALGDAGWLRDDATVVIEQRAAAGPVALPDGWLIGWERGYGDTLVVLAGRP